VDARDGEDVRRVVVEDEGLVEGDRRDGPPVTAEPPLGGQGFQVESAECRLDVGVRAQILSITCLTTV
jgi:hypothetical protein